MPVSRSRLLPRLLLLAALALSQHTTAQEPAPLFEGVIINRDGAPRIELLDYRGKVVFLDFWASWCPPCLVSLPAYDRLYRELGNDQFEILAINVDENPQNGVDFLQDHPVSYPVLSDPDGRIGVPYRIRTLPRAFLIDRAGNVVATYRNFKVGDEVGLKQEIQALLQQ